MDIKSNFAAHVTPHFRVLSDDQIYEIHLATLEVLERTGVQIPEEEAVDLLSGAGARVSDGGQVRIPSYLVEDALRSAPERITLANRDGERRVFLEGNKVYFGTGSDCPYLLDSYTGERRPFQKEDVEKAARLCDHLPNIDFIMSLGLVSDAPTATSDRHQFEAMLVNTKKPIVFTAHDVKGMSDIIEMAAIAMGGREELRRSPCIVLYAEPISPLRHFGAAVRKLLLAAEEEIPAIYTPCPMCGATAPSTLAGTLVTANAECLSGLVISQLKRKGAPFITGGFISIMDMREAILSYGAPELSLLSAALTEIAHFYRLPMFGTAGCSDAKVLDEQAAVESAISCLMSALSGAHLVHDVGFLEYALTGSYEMVVLTDEIIGMVKRIMGGIDVSRETLAVDVIDRVGPGGNFLVEAHTLKHFRQEQWFPDLVDRRTYENWTKAGAKTMGQRAKEKVKKILDEHRPEPLPPDRRRAIAEIVARGDP